MAVGMAVGPARWRVRLLGAVEAHGPAGTITRWPSRAVAALLARLALAPERAHPREELVELLWPGVALDIGRNRLRQALSALKTLLEPPGPHPAPVLAADRHAVRVLPGALACDARDLLAQVRAGQPLAGAAAAAIDELMPGHYDEWIVDERLRLAALFEQALAAPPAAPGAAAGAAAAPALPAYLTRPFGIERRLAQLRATVCEHRLVNVHGPGGSGKTRLAAEALRALAAAPREDGGFDGLFFVSLSSCESAARMLQTVADVLGERGSGEPRARLLARLDRRRVLLVLDNLEQLSPEADREIAALLAALPRLHVLATSRRVLGLDGEVCFDLAGLALPPPGAAPDELAHSPAVALFVDRARAARADFQLGVRDAEAVADLVRLLGGMPLAIELAASRVRSLAPAELLQRLREAGGSPTLDLLARPRSGSACDARHASMRHMVQSSWRHLGPEHSALLQSMAVLAAPADATLIAAVAGQPPARVRALLDELHDLSLLAPTTGEGAVPMHALLQPLREFAAERAGAEALRSARGRLRASLLQRAAGTGPQEAARMSAWLPHVHQAIVHAPADGDGRRALELAVALRPLWQWEILPLADLRALEQCLDAAAHDVPLLADALEVLATACVVAGEVDAARAHSERACALPLDERRRSIVLAGWALAHYHAGARGAELQATAEQAVQLAERSGDDAACAGAYRVLAVLACNLNLEYARCEALMARAQALHERLGDHRMALRRLHDRAVMWAWLGREAEAAGVMRECAAAALREGDGPGAIVSLRQLGRVCVRMRRWEDAAAAFRQSLQLSWQRWHAVEIGVALLHLPHALVHQPDALELAARLQGFACAHWSRLFGELNRIEQRELRRTRRLLRLRLGAARAQTLRLQGASWSLGEAVAKAL